MKPINCIYKCLGWDITACLTRQHILEACGDKLTDQLEITQLLLKINSTYAMMKNLMRERHKDYIKYHESNVVELEDAPSSSEDEDKKERSSDTSSDDGKDQMNFKDMVRKNYMFSNMEKAYLYSIIKDLNLPDDLKTKVLNDEFKRIWQASGPQFQRTGQMFAQQSTGAMSTNQSQYHRGGHNVVYETDQASSAFGSRQGARDFNKFNPFDDHRASATTNAHLTQTLKLGQREAIEFDAYSNTNQKLFKESP